MSSNPVADLVRRSLVRRRPPKNIKKQSQALCFFYIIIYKILFSVVSSPNAVLAFGMVRGDWSI